MRRAAIQTPTFELPLGTRYHAGSLMLLAPGNRLGVYEVLSPLGAGGMGEVYRARDTKLNRDVAIKVLPELFALDAERLARFTREAQTLAALNHPNIAHIHGLDESGAVRALVMELVDGDDLSTIIARGPLPLADALAIVRQLADGLEAAHELGIVHRDLKPANVKVRADGTVKVLDFGLAKALGPLGNEGSSATADAMHSPTLTAGTEMGVILGTASYMAPEQARGRAVDKRADIWAFGVVLYEMLTGGHPFTGQTISDTLAAVLTRDVDLAALPEATPPAVRELVERCLQKDPRQRLRDIGDARLQIDRALHGKPGASSSSIQAPAAHARRRAWSPWLIAPIVGIAAAGAAWVGKPTPQATSQPLLRLSIALPPGQQVTTVPAISRDGNMIAYAAGRTPATSQLYLRALDDFMPRAVASSAEAQNPFFSPDGRSVAYFAGGKLRRAAVTGGAAIDITPSATSWGGTWTDDGRIVYVSGLNAGLWSVPAEGGLPEQLTKPDGAAAGYAHVFPQQLPGTPGNNDVLFAFWGQTFYMARLSMRTRTWGEITPSARTAVVATATAATGIYAASGHVIVNDGAGGVRAAPWRPTVTTAVNPETVVLENIYWSLGTERPWIDVSDSGAAVYVPGNPSNRHVVWVDRRSQVTQLSGEPEQVHQATVSRDGRRVAYSGKSAQWVVDLATGARTRIVSDVRTWHGGWLPGDNRVVVSSNKGGDWDLYTVSANAGGELTPLLTTPFAQHPQDVAQDGSVIYLERHPLSGSDLWVLRADGQPSPLVATPFNESSARVSADGRYVAYASDESGRNDVYAIPLSGGGDRVRVSVDGGTGPVWSRDGRELFYRNGDDLISVRVTSNTPALVFGERRRLIDLSPFDAGYFHEFDVSADGQQFLLIRSEPSSRPVRLDVIVNWFDELMKKVRQ